MLRCLTSRIGRGMLESQRISSAVVIGKESNLCCSLTADHEARRLVWSGPSKIYMHLHPSGCIAAPLLPNVVLRNPAAISPPFLVPSRTFIKHDDKYGKKISDPNVLERFFRLPWGGWIKKKMGSSKRVWKMTSRRKRRKDQHVFVSPRYSKMFDRMVTRYYREPTYFVNDIYEPYQKRYDLTHPYYVDKMEAGQRKAFFPEISPQVLARRKSLDATQQFAATYR